MDRRNFLKTFFSAGAYLSLGGLTGCTGIWVEKAQKPSEVIQGAPVVTQEEKVLFISKVPAGEVLKRCTLSKNYTVYQLQERIKAHPGKWEIFINEQRVALRNWGGKGKKRKLYTGYLEPGFLLPGRLVQENGNDKSYKIEFIGQCGNEVEDLYVVKSPKIVTITNTEKYRDVDYTPAIWTGLLGVLAGVGIGYWVWHGGETVVTAAVGKVCAPGKPGPRPL